MTLMEASQLLGLIFQVIILIVVVQLLIED